MTQFLLFLHNYRFTAAYTSIVVTIILCIQILRVFGVL